jgi:hypothetical protein
MYFPHKSTCQFNTQWSQMTTSFPIYTICTGERRLSLEVTNRYSARRGIPRHFMKETVYYGIHNTS